ncbi:hypothetical protein LTR84_010871 [Exophiala bonariae]|uniref:WD40 repeat-like protein n=1 Tax=Exophiala bonariae TaxID=1690606 RepID=A0AAV9NL92_9EURO|nr:hypothetical protein LTR84_010871 [Exophiala bonariae]
MANSGSAEGLHLLPGDSQASAPLTNHDGSEATVSMLFRELKELSTGLEQSYSQVSEITAPAEQSLQQELEKQESARADEFSKHQRTRKEYFDKAEAAERQNFNQSQAQRHAEFENKKKLREEQLSLQMSGLGTQTAMQEHIKLERDAEDQHEESQFQHNRADKAARRRREDNYRQSEATHTAAYHHALRMLHNEFDDKRKALDKLHIEKWRENNGATRVRIEQVQSTLWRKLFGSSDAQNSFRENPVVLNTEIPTPPPDLTTPLGERGAQPTSNRYPSHQRQATSTSDLDRHPYLNEWISNHVDLPPDTDGRHSNTEEETTHTQASSTQPPRNDMNQTNLSTLRPQDECQIQAVQNALESLGEDCVRKDLWKNVAKQMEQKGYKIEPQSAAAMWSKPLRQVCRDRGYSWAEKVMKTASYKTERKRRTLSEGNGLTPLASSSSNPRLVKRTKRSQGHRDTVAVQNDSARMKDGISQLRTFNGCSIWSGASYDVTELDWAPDGKRFLVGSVAKEEASNRNQPCNLVLGSISSRVLREMPQTHCTSSGFTHDGSVLQKPLYRAVTGVQFTDGGNHAVTAGYDGYVRIWDIRQEEQPTCVDKIEHKKKVIVMALGKQNNLLATGIENGPQSLQIWSGNSDCSRFRSVAIPHLKGMDSNESPMCLAFGNSPVTQGWLVAGFGWDEDIRPGDGRLSVWSIDESGLTERIFKPDHAQVSDVAWLPSGGGFAAATTGDLKSRLERSCVQIYNISQNQSGLKLTCPAIDMNMVSFSPYQEHYVAASCTDGKVYVWDTRSPRNLLHTLSHGTPVRRCEAGAVGVRMTEWLDETTLLSGASDGILKRWDIRLSSENALVEDVYDCEAEIMSGRLSPDKSSLLLGDADDSLHLLQKNGTGAKTLIEEFTFIEANRQGHIRNSSDMVKQERNPFLESFRDSSLFDGSPTYTPPEHFPSTI